MAARDETKPGRAGGVGDAREAWRLLVPLVYPPPFLAIAREHGLRPATFGALRMLDEPRAMGEIAAFLHCDNSNVTGIVDGLEEKGLVERRPAEHDRRVKLIALTAAGRRLRARLMKAVEVPPEWLRDLSPGDQQALREILERAAPS
ncbi:MAG TPA: MarR family transcriptional regulator [Solirubrobacterales bacterium]|nr:MarR family transcriptional regulator [Solirubrobacterales bacterium]